MGRYTLIAGINAVVLTVFGIIAVSQRNIEFLYYLGVIVFLTVLIAASLKHVHYPTPLLLALSFWGWMHMGGGVIPVNETVLYDIVVIPLIGSPFHVLRYDQLIHLYGCFVVSITAWYILKDRLTGPALLTAITIGIIGIGLGSINEIIELFAVMTIQETNVGEYYNMALDLLANFIGATAAAIWVYQRQQS